MPRQVEKIQAYQPAPPAEVVSDAAAAAPAVRASLGLTTPGCQDAENCPARGRGHWLRHVDKSGERTVKHEDDGSFWNRSCPVVGCTMRVFG